MKRHYPQVPFTVVMGSVRDEEKLSATFARYHPEVVFHAAAHKHVPLMENDPEEAVKNNVLGTYQTAVAAAAHGTERFILISTDKAVNPTNVMGASKRMCEFVVKGLADTSVRTRALAPDTHPTRFAAVRFGNVLGSNGSVIPLFKRQIEQGGPVTITHPEMTRYFMTIPEAARLVIEAGAMANGGEIFVLDMGKPVKIADLAKDMIRLAGLKAETDIRIEYVGLRPGEKLYEELVMSNESTEPTYHARISRLQDVGVLREALENDLRFLSDALVGGLDMRTALRQVVPTFSPDHPTGEEAQG
jgi:FlaA1/EpsC-like NDP-sugar epimerase